MPPRFPIAFLALALAAGTCFGQKRPGEDMAGTKEEAGYRQGVGRVLWSFPEGMKAIFAVPHWTAGARVICEPRRGYGRACRAGVQAVSPQSEVVVFLDGDGSDAPELMARLLAPIAAGTHDLVIGSRTRGQREPGSMNLVQLLAGRAAGLILAVLYGVRFTDMCPFRAIRREALEKLGMREETYGWNLEMQIRAARAGLRILEVPVDHRRRTGGKSKVSGTVAGTIRAGTRILFTFFRVVSSGKHS